VDSGIVDGGWWNSGWWKVDCGIVEMVSCPCGIVATLQQWYGCSPPRLSELGDILEI